MCSSASGCATTISSGSSPGVSSRAGDIHRSPQIGAPLPARADIPHVPATPQLHQYVSTHGEETSGSASSFGTRPWTDYRDSGCPRKGFLIEGGLFSSVPLAVSPVTRRITSRREMREQL